MAQAAASIETNAFVELCVDCEMSVYTITLSHRYRGNAGYLRPDRHQIFLQQPLLVGDFVGMSWLFLVLLHLLMGQI